METCERDKRASELLTADFAAVGWAEPAVFYGGVFWARLVSGG